MNARAVWIALPGMPARLLAMLASVTVAALLAGCGGSSSSRSTLHACPAGLAAPWRCTVVRVPLDRSGKVPGVVSLAVADYHEPGPPRPAVLALAGGPGSAAIPGAAAFRARL